MGHTPVRNHLSAPAGYKTGDRLDPAARELILELRRIAFEYAEGMVVGTQAMREIDALAALWFQQETILPSEYLPWEGSEVAMWIP